MRRLVRLPLLAVHRSTRGQQPHLGERTPQLAELDQPQVGELRREDPPLLGAVVREQARLEGIARLLQHRERLVIAMLTRHLRPPPSPSETVEQLAASTLAIPQDTIANLLQRLVLHYVPIRSRKEATELWALPGGVLSMPGTVISRSSLVSRTLITSELRRIAAEISIVSRKVMSR